MFYCLTFHLQIKTKTVTTKFFFYLGPCPKLHDVQNSDQDFSCNVKSFNVIMSLTAEQFLCAKAARLL